MIDREVNPDQPKPSILQEEDMKEMIERRHIAPEDLHLIEQLAACPKDLFLEFHNFFSGNQNDLAGALKSEINKLKAEQADRKKFLEAYLELAGKYDWTVCWNVNVVFERRGREKYQ